MRTNRERLAETIWDLIVEIHSGPTNSVQLVDEYTERIMQDINAGIVQAERSGV